MDMEPISLESCPKGYTRDLDKAFSPRQTIANVKERVAASGLDLVAGTRRIDVGRLGIPVYLGICGADARRIMPVRKQMGKGSSPEQAEASALMELMERYAFFSFWREVEAGPALSWDEAEAIHGGDLIPIADILRSVNDGMEEAQARKLLNLARWHFVPATDLGGGKVVWLPLDWFKMLSEFNGSAAGNRDAESILQGISELVERHVCCIADRERPVLATIDQDSLDDPVLEELARAFRDKGIRLALKDMSMGMPLPTVAALAWDPATFPQKSEIVFTAGTASSPRKAAIRAITEVAQLGGDFCTGACYEASGLPKFSSLEQCQWLLRGPEIKLKDLPCVEDGDIAREAIQAVRLLPCKTYVVETTNPALGIPAHYCIAPGLQFRERDANQSLGLFIGRKLVEEEEPQTALAGLEVLAQIRPEAHYLPFFRGLLALRLGDLAKAGQCFQEAIPLQPDDESRAMAYFYAAYALTQGERHADAVPLLERAASLCPQMKEYVNLLGAAHYRLGDYARAEDCFSRVLRIDKGSAIDLANRGVCRLLLGREEEARQDLSAALELDPGLDFARKRLAELAGGQ